MIKAIAQRRSIRNYTDQPITNEILHSLIDSARLAPSGRHTQPWHFIVVRSQETKENIVEVCGNQTWMLKAPVFIVCVADIRTRVAEDIDIEVDELSDSKPLKLVLRDTTIAVEHLVLEAVEQGLGSCWVALFKQQEIRPVLGIPADKYVVSVITLGYPAETPKEKTRKSFADMVHFERW